MVNLFPKHTSYRSKTAFDIKEIAVAINTYPIQLLTESVLEDWASKIQELADVVEAKERT